eukprot:SAG25_NODE_6154_length_583_cov_1.530992_1_plen_44_part_01
MLLKDGGGGGGGPPPHLHDEGVGRGGLLLGVRSGGRWELPCGLV